MTKKILAIEPKVYRYWANEPGKPGESELLERLTDQQDTRTFPVQELQDVLLGDTGLIQTHYRLSTIALGQLCSILAPGLSPLVQSLAGMRHRVKEFPSERYSTGLAIRVVNLVITKRFDLLKGKAQLIMDRRNRMIEGVVGPRYRFLSNLEMYRRVDAFVQDEDKPARFYAAAMDGRRLQLRYKNPERAFAIETKLDTMEPFYGGWHFSNSELGDCCVKGSSILFRQWSGTSAIRPYSKRTKLVHLEGVRFEKQFCELLRQVQIRVAEIPQLSSAVQNAASTLLGLSRDDPVRYERRFNVLQTRLMKGGVKTRAAKDAMTRAVVNGSYKADMMSIGNRVAITKIFAPNLLSKASTRTVYDVFNGLCDVASRCHPAQQELLEQAAYNVLTNQLSIVKG